MTATSVETLRNIALCGHGSAGKTSLIDALLETTGAVAGHHSVEDGTSISDFDPKRKPTTIQSNRQSPTAIFMNII